MDKEACLQKELHRTVLSADTLIRPKRPAATTTKGTEGRPRREWNPPVRSRPQIFIVKTFKLANLHRSILLFCYSFILFRSIQKAPQLFKIQSGRQGAQIYEGTVQKDRLAQYTAGPQITSTGISLNRNWDHPGKGNGK